MDRSNGQISLQGQSNEITGFVGSVIFQNEETGYKVIEVESADGLDFFTAFGTMPDVEIGEKIEATGRWRNHSTYGEQFEIQEYTRSLPEDKDSMERYLGSGVIKGVGAVLAHRIIEKFGDDTFHILESQPERLAEVRGISAAKAVEIGEQFIDKAASREALVYLQSLGLSPAMALRIFQAFGSKTIDVVRTNPYLLAERVKGIGFQTADEIAQKSGLSPDSPGRLRGAIRFVLSEAAGEGHTYLPEEALTERLFHLIGIEGELIDNALAQADMTGLIVQTQSAGENRIYLNSYYKAESVSAARLMSLAAEQATGKREAWRKLIREAEKAKDIELSEKQRVAVLTALENGVTVITGGPGTGKTTLLTILLDVMDALKMEYLLASPTGRAAKRMTQATGREAQTIHRLLEIQSGLEGDSARQVFARNEENPLETQAVIVDEVSMVDINLLSHLLKAMVPGMRLVLLGDKDQLPSVGAGNVLGDIIRSEVIPVVKLTEIYRQSGESEIVLNAHLINEGKMPDLSSKDGDFFFMSRLQAESVLETLIPVVKTRFPKFAGVDPISEIQVLSPMKKGPLGVASLNQRLQAALNEPMRWKKELVVGQTTYRVGDKVLQTKNNYELEWRVLNKYDHVLDQGKGVFNGDTGRIKAIEEGHVVVVFDGNREVSYEYSDLSQLELAYAMTIHKSQGTECPVVVIPLLDGPGVLFTRNLLYTAVTRAKNYCIIIGSADTVRRMVENDRHEIRYTSLDDCLKKSAEENRLLKELLSES